MQRNILEVTVDRVIENLTAVTAAKGDRSEPGPHDIIFRGGLKAVNQYFHDNDYSDGLPIIPPTREEVDSFLRFTDRQPEEMLGVLLPDNRAATVWSIAVNAVMAGCRPEYLPILAALSAQRSRLSTASNRQGDLRQHLARGVGLAAARTSGFEKNRVPMYMLFALANA